jgi:hypothetical protein
MPSSYTRHSINALRERGKTMAAARWKLDRERRALAMPAPVREIEEIEVQNLPRRQGDAVGCLQYHDFITGKIYRWVAEIGDRSDRVVFRSPDGRRGKSAGWAFLLRCVRMVILGNFEGLRKGRKS